MIVNSLGNPPNTSPTPLAIMYEPKKPQEKIKTSLYLQNVTVPKIIDIIIKETQIVELLQNPVNNKVLNKIPMSIPNQIPTETIPTL